MDDHSSDGERRQSTTRAGQWDSKYAEAGGALWSGRPNGRLVAEVAGLSPGRALDVGSGEGADAIWLAEQGWAVTAVDISEVAVARARTAADRVGAIIHWIVDDVLRTSLPAGSFDLVSMHYPALPKAGGEEPIRALLETVRPGGLLLAVYHDLDDEHRAHMRSHGFDPSDYVGADDLGDLLRNGFTVERRAVEPRLEPPSDSPHIADIVILARRDLAGLPECDIHGT
jgi:SAM-dependent methyltransferase